MAEPEDRFGIPTVPLPNAPSVFGRGGVSFLQAQSLESGNRNRLASTLEFRDRVHTLVRREQTRAQAAAAMSQISRLNPRDPDFLQKRNDIIAQNPNATLDEAMGNLLKMQDDIYSEAEAGRARDQQFEDFKTRTEYNEGILDKRNEKRQGQAEQARGRAGVEGLSDFGRERFEGYRDFGFRDEEALKKAQADEQNEGAVLSLLEGGFTEQEIFGGTAEDGTELPSLVDKDGKVDPRKVASALGEKKRAEAEKKLKADERKALEDRLERLNDLLEANKLESDDVKGPIRQQIQDVMNQLNGGTTQPGAGGGMGPGVSTRTGGSTSKPKPKSRAVDRLFPSNA